MRGTCLLLLVLPAEHRVLLVFELVAVENWRQFVPLLPGEGVGVARLPIMWLEGREERCTP